MIGGVIVIDNQKWWSENISLIYHDNKIDRNCVMNDNGQMDNEQRTMNNGQWTMDNDNEQRTTNNGQLYYKYLIRFSLQNRVFISHTIISTISWQRVMPCYCFACKNRKYVLLLCTIKLKAGSLSSVSHEIWKWSIFIIVFISTISRVSTIAFISMSKWQSSWLRSHQSISEQCVTTCKSLVRVSLHVYINNLATEHHASLVSINLTIYIYDLVAMHRIMIVSRNDLHSDMNGQAFGDGH